MANADNFLRFLNMVSFFTQVKYKSVSQSVNQSASQSVSQAGRQSVNQSVSQSVTFILRRPNIKIVYNKCELETNLSQLTQGCCVMILI